jgi:hypothetical protein
MTHRFMDRDDDLSVINAFYRLAAEDRDRAREFILEHTDLTDEQVDQVFTLEDTGDDDDAQDALGILLGGGPHRTRDEIGEAYEQVWGRRWYRHAKASQHPAGVGGMVERELAIEDLNDPKYYDDYGMGYLDGIQSALCWVLGEEWGMLDT